MAEYVSAPITEIPDDLLQRVLDRLADVFPGWQASEANLDYWLAEGFAQIAAQIAEGASDVPPAIFRYFGANLIGLPPRDALPASGLTTWTLIDSAGHTIPEGTTVTFDGVVFQTIADVVVPAGQSTAVNVFVQAFDPGEDGNALTGTGDLIDLLDFIDAVELEGPTGNGSDAEADADYLDRLAGELRLLTPRPILAREFAIIARRVAGVTRATAIDTYKPGPPWSGTAADPAAERTVTVAVCDEDGQPVAPTVRTTVKTMLESLREANFVVYVIDPAYTSVNVAVSVAARDGFDAASVQADVEAALASYLNPATWGAHDFGDGEFWTNDTQVRYLDVAHVVLGVQGVRKVNSLALNGLSAGADVTLTGPVGLPTPGTLSVTVA